MTSSGVRGLIGTVLSDRYRLVSKIGSGGMSTVYLAEDETLDRPVAIKVLHREISEQPDQLERFRREARAAARLSHPNLVAVIDAGEDGGTPYIVFEYIDGETLKERIKRQGTLPSDEAVAYAIEIGRGLAAVHGRRLVHRDVKPQNVLLDIDGRAKITDFGIARSLEAEGLTATGRVLGTTDYVAPEQAMGDDADERSDVYSLGVVLFEMLTGDVPFAAETQVGVAMKHVNEPMPDVQELRPDVSAAVAAVIEQATSKDPARRYPTIAAMVGDLEGTLEVEAARGGGTHGEATAVLESVPRRRLARPQRAPRAGVVMGLIGLGLIAAAVIVGGSGNLGSLGDGDDSAGNEIRLPSSAVQDFDPIGGDGEHPEDTGFAVDGNPTGTAWSTETYSEEDYGTKDGVGIYVDAGKPVEAKAVEIRSAVGGWDVELYSAPGQGQAPEDLDGWKRLTGVEDVREHQRIGLGPSEPSRLYLVWITKLAPADDDSGQYRVEISDLRLLT